MGNEINAAKKAVAIGNNITTNQSDNVVAIGNNITVNAGKNGAVVIGNRSTADGSETNTASTVEKFTHTRSNAKYTAFAGKVENAGSVFSVGSNVEGKQRKVINMAAGNISATSTDCVNGSQLHSVINKTHELLDTKADKTTTYTFNIANGETVATKTDGVAKTWTLGGNSNLTFGATSDLSLSTDGNGKVVYGLSEATKTKLNETWQASANAETAATEAKTSATNAATSATNAATSASNAAKSAEKATVAENSVAKVRDIVQESQVVSEKRIVQLNNRIDRVDTKLRGGIAGATAIANIPQATKPNASLVGVGVANYNGENAIAVGFSRMSENSDVIIKLSGAANSTGDYNVGAGIGYQW